MHAVATLRAVVLVSSLARSGAAATGRQAAEASANPIRKVVTLLQNMQAKVTEEAKREEDLFDKFSCYCKTNGNDLGQTIEEAKAKIESLTSAIESNTERKAQTEMALKDHTASRTEAKSAMAEATALREKEAKAFAKAKSDAETNISALTAATRAIEKGMSGAFLQTTAANVVRRWVMEKAEVSDEKRQELLSFLSGQQSEGYAPASGEIVGILKEMNDEMAHDLSDETAQEQSAKATYEGLMAAKTKEVNALTAQIEEETMRVGELGVEVSSQANDLEATKDQLGDDTVFLAELGTMCDTKSKEWEEVKATRAAELVALAETITMLNSDDALELFKKTLPAPSASFVQLAQSEAIVRSKALSFIRGAKRSSALVHPEFDFIEMALQGKTAGFEKVIKMIDDMVATLKAEQSDDDSKQTYCTSTLDEAEDKKKGLERAVSVSETAISDLEGSISALADEIKALKAGIKALDKSVAEATEMRKEESEEFHELTTNNAAAKEVLAWAKNRLFKFYQPKMHKEEQKSPAALVQIVARRRGFDAPPPAPEFTNYAKKTAESTGVIAMIDLIISDIDKEVTAAQVEEEDAQKDYEALMSKAGEKRAQDSKSITEKSSAKAAGEESLQAEKENKEGSTKELMMTSKFISELHAECDWLLKYFDVRKSARADEVDSLGKAKAVLNGADFSLIQTHSAA